MFKVFEPPHKWATWLMSPFPGHMFKVFKPPHQWTTWVSKVFRPCTNRPHVYGLHAPAPTGHMIKGLWALFPNRPICSVFPASRHNDTFLSLRDPRQWAIFLSSSLAYAVSYFLVFYNLSAQYRLIFSLCEAWHRTIILHIFSPIGELVQSVVPSPSPAPQFYAHI